MTAFALRYDLLVSGTVRDVAGTPVPGAWVTVDGRRVRTDHAGEFEVVTAQGGPVAVRVDGAVPMLVPAVPDWRLADGTGVVVVDVTRR
jgi:hypothetical protein